MWLPLTLAVRILVALICAALIFAPGATLAMPASGGDSMRAMHDNHDMPCPAPCQDCGDEDMTVSCVAACMGLVAGVPVVADAFAAVRFESRVTIMTPEALRGRYREPDTPPPKTFLA